MPWRAACLRPLIQIVLLLVTAQFISELLIKLSTVF